MHSESVDEYANRINNLGKRIEFNDSTLMFALLNGLKPPAIKGQVLAKKIHNPSQKRSMARDLRNCQYSLARRQQKS